MIGMVVAAGDGIDDSDSGQLSRINDPLGDSRMGFVSIGVFASQ